MPQILSAKLIEDVHSSYNQTEVIIQSVLSFDIYYYSFCQYFELDFIFIFIFCFYFNFNYNFYIFFVSVIFLFCFFFNMFIVCIKFELF